MSIETSIEQFFASLWDSYLTVTPQAGRVHDLFTSRGETVINDHVAFRTLSDSPIALERLEPLLLKLGYQPWDSYPFTAKKLKARSYNHPGADAPRIFVSELQRELLSEPSQQILERVVAQIPEDAADDLPIFWRGLLWNPVSVADYRVLLDESEYAAWTLTMGLRVNHFTVSVNHLQQTSEVADINQLLKDSGFAINSVGGEVKGNPALLLEQSSTLADRISVTFAGGIKLEVPSCFYEFAKRHRTADGQLFEGFIADNADKIFESTNVAA